MPVSASVSRTATVAADAPGLTMPAGNCQVIPLGSGSRRHTISTSVSVTTTAIATASVAAFVRGVQSALELQSDVGVRPLVPRGDGALRDAEHGGHLVLRHPQCGPEGAGVATGPPIDEWLPAGLGHVRRPVPTTRLVPAG